WLPGYRSIGQHPALLYVGGVSIVLGLLLGAVHVSFSQGSLARTRKALGILATTTGAVLLVGHLEAKPSHPGWDQDLSAARERARAASAPMLVDFGADWCQACGELD